MIKNIIIIVGISLGLYLDVKGQITMKKMTGDWTICAANKHINIGDTISLHQDINYAYLNQCCHYLTWVIKGKNIEIDTVNSCTEPGRVISSIKRRTIQIKRSNSHQVIDIYQNDELLEVYRVTNYKEFSIERYPYDIKVITLVKE